MPRNVPFDSSETGSRMMSNRIRESGFSISVVTVCLNAQHSIERTLKSVVGQNYERIEYIIVDGKSSDSTLNIVDSYGHCINKVISEPDKGIYDAMNKGWRACQGTYVYFLNSGDTFNDDDALSDISKQSSNADIVYGDMKYDYGDGRKEIKRQPEKMGYGRFVTTSLWQPATMIKRTLLDRYEGFDESFKICGDYEFFLRAMFSGQTTTQYIARTFSVFDTNGISRDKNFYLQHYAERKRVQQKHLPWFYYVIARMRHFLIREKRTLFREI